MSNLTYLSIVTDIYLFIWDQYLLKNFHVIEMQKIKTKSSVILIGLIISILIFPNLVNYKDSVDNLEKVRQ